MGVKDSKAKEYLSDNRRFSEICNYMLFGGAKIIKPQDLKECDSTEVLSIFGIDRKQIIRQKWRDLLKSVSVKYTGNMYIVLIGIEAQTDVHYAMPVKTMMYDALNYGDQVNEAKKRHQKNKDYKSSEEFLSGFTQDDKLTPVITITSVSYTHLDVYKRQPHKLSLTYEKPCRRLPHSDTRIPLRYGISELSFGKYVPPIRLSPLKVRNVFLLRVN